jgi:hypothetical protein
VGLTEQISLGVVIAEENMDRGNAGFADNEVLSLLESHADENFPRAGISCNFIKTASSSLKTLSCSIVSLP